MQSIFKSFKHFNQYCQHQLPYSEHIHNQVVLSCLLFAMGYEKEISAIDLPIAFKQNEKLFLHYFVKRNWKKIDLNLLYTVFQDNLAKGENYLVGRYYTSELDLKIKIGDMMVISWHKKIDEAENFEELYHLWQKLNSYKIFDPACCCGNFLFIAFKELKLIEYKLIAQLQQFFIYKESSKEWISFLNTCSFVNIYQCYGYDKNPISVELAKISLIIAKEEIYTNYKESENLIYQKISYNKLRQNIKYQRLIF